MKFKGCNISRRVYGNGNTALELWSKREGPIAKATVNMDEVLPENMAYIKTYSENEGMLETLVEVGIVDEILWWVETGFVRVPLCRLNLDRCNGVIGDEISNGGEKGK